jgi:hypothetical protein
MCARLWVRVWAHPYPRRTVRALSDGVDRMRLCAQAFHEATVFNADIGAWNTASVSNMYIVCAALRPGGAPPQAFRTRSAGLRLRRPIVRGGTADAFACAHTCRHSLGAGPPWV